MSAETLGADLLGEVKEEGLDEVCSTTGLFYVSSRYADLISSFYAHSESLRKLLRLI